MRFEPLPLEGAMLIHLDPISDERGENARLWCAHEFAAAGLDAMPAQVNFIRNHRRGTVRGLHWQVAPWRESKLFRVVRGALHDVIVDLRPESPTYLRNVAVQLSADRDTMLFVPTGFAQGFQTLEDGTELTYQVSAPYTPEAGRGARYDDPAFGVEWPLAVSQISDKDRSWPDFTPADGVDRVGAP